MNIAGDVSAIGFNSFRSVDFDWTRHLQSVWRDPPYHVDDLHKDLVESIIDDFISGTKAPDASPLGRVIVGGAGAGKTHLVGQLRRRAWDSKAWFVLLDIVGIKDFWSTAALCFLTSLQQPMHDGRSQTEAVLTAILRKFGEDPKAKEAIFQWQQKPDRTQVDTVQLYIRLLRVRYPGDALKHADVVRALLLLSSDDIDNASLAHSWLQGFEADAQRRQELGFSKAPPDPSEIVRGLSWLMSLVGPTIVAVDQIDAIVSASNLRAGSSEEEADDSERMAQSIIQLLAGGLMDLKDVTTRSLTIVTCLEATWQVLQKWALTSAMQRFRELDLLEPVSSSKQIENLISKRLEQTYSEHGFTPPYSTWPFTASAIDQAKGLLPRRILMKCDQHRRHCVVEGKVSECASLADNAPTPTVSQPANALETEFTRQLSLARVDGLLAHEDDKPLRDLLMAVLGVYAEHFTMPDDIDVSVQSDPDLRRPSLHGRLSFTFRGEGDREQHYCFRVLGHPNAIAFQARLRAAMTASGIDRALPFRHLFILRRDGLPSGPKTAALAKSFKGAGGKFIEPSDDDLRAFVALCEMRKNDLNGFDAWLRTRQPLCETNFFKEVGLCPPPFVGRSPDSKRMLADEKPLEDEQRVRSQANLESAAKSAVDSELIAPRGPQPKRPEIPSGDAPPGRTAPQITIGRRYAPGLEGEPQQLATSLLHRHTAILAGSGSGKTVLLRRIVEEAAVLGIPAIVLDTNNDLARLGDMWPTTPPQWNKDDAIKAKTYRERVEVVIWTPGVAAGNPLTLSLLPDFGALDDEDERNQAIEMAHATLVPFIGASGASGKLREGVLADALRHFAKRGSGGLVGLADLLSEMPEGVSQIGNATKLGAAIADQLRAAIAVNPLLKSRGQSLDARVLFQGSSLNTRISVINFGGVVSDEGRQAFVNQLQMNLFTWIKKNPSEHGRLYVLDEAQNFAPSQVMTPCKASTIALAAQARKYGLGMVFATQAPKGIDNKIISNCTTHFYGKMNSPTTIQAIRELMAAKGADASDIGNLSSAEFYFSTEGQDRPVKIRTALCLTYHPQTPMSVGDILIRARSNAHPQH